MVTMAKGDLSVLLFNLRKMLNHRIMVLCITAVLAFYVLWQAGSLVWKLWLLNAEPPQTIVLLPLSPENTGSESLQNLLRYPLVRSESLSTTAESASINAPETSLNLKLVGLMYSTNKDEARAIIESPNDGARSYATRERVADNAEIYSIEPDRVILFHAGRQEALMLDPKDETSGSQQGTGNQSVPDPNNNQASTGLPQGSSQNLVDAPKKMDDLMRDFSATPVVENGELLGFRLKALKKPEIMKEWGVGPDDVITAVNGIPLNSPGKIMVLYDKLKKQREFEITLNNGGNSRTITVDLNE